MTRRALLALAMAGRGGGQIIGGGARVNGTSRFGSAVNTPYVMFVGQSLAAGGLGTAAVTTSQPYTNRTFAGGSILGDQYTELPPVASIASLIPLVEGVTQDQESPVSAFANQVAAFARAAGYGAAHDMLAASWARSGALYSAIQKGAARYDYSLQSVQQAKALLGSVIVPALMCVHGESDGSCGYAQKVTNGYPSATTWQSDYEADIKALTGQSGAIPMFISQPLAKECTAAGNPRPPWFYDGLLGLYEQYQATFPMVGPKYVLPQNADRIHLTNLGYRWLGEYYAKAYWRKTILGQAWDCLRPLSTSVSGSVITITFHVPVPPMVFDTTLVSNTQNYGFTYGDTPTITGVSITNDGTGTNVGVVQITLSGPPVNTSNMTVEYAGGAMSSPRGNLRDSDAVVSLNGNFLYNWCVHFAKKSTWSCCPGTA